MPMLISLGRSPTINIKSTHYPERPFYSDYTENTLPEIILQLCADHAIGAKD
jgi:hypothetical protein